MKNFIYLLLVSLVFSSCTFPDEENIYENTIKVGHIYCSDGSIIHPNAFLASKKEAVGVVFWTNTEKNNNDKAYAVALRDLEKNYLINSNIDMKEVTEDENDFRGASNTSAYIERVLKDTLTNSPVIKSIVNYAPGGVTGWFLPSAGQAKAISANLPAIYDSFSIVEGVKFNDWYWTSTEDGNGQKSPIFFGLVISFNEGRITNSLKKNKYNIRPIISIR